MDVLRGAVREFFQIKTLEAKVERSQVTGVGRKKSATFFIRYAHPDQFFLESLEPAGLVAAQDDGKLVAWNAGTKQGYQGDAGALSQEQREAFFLVPGFSLNPLIPINPKGYDLRPRAAGKNKVGVTMVPKASGYPPIEIDFLTNPYRVDAMRIEGGGRRTETTYSGWKQINGAWMFSEMRVLAFEERMKKEMTLRFDDIKLNEAHPANWLPKTLPEGFERIGREFFSADMQ